MTAEDLKRRLDEVLPFLDLVKRFVPGVVDDRVVDYVRAISQSDELLTLLAADITAIDLKSIPNQRK